MYQAFNCGVGFIFSLAPLQAAEIVSTLDAEIIGEVVAGLGKVFVESKFGKEIVEFF